MTMFNDFKQLISSDVCLSCDGCCRFDREKSDWRPKMGADEVKAISGGHQLEEGGYLKTKLCHGLHACEFLNPDDFKCGIYDQRPFECRLYPFMLTKRKEMRGVSVHLSCPYFVENKGVEQYEDYVGYLKEYFKREDVVKLLKENDHLFGEYAGHEDELEVVFELLL